jgi:hypothetical protein
MQQVGNKPSLLQDAYRFRHSYGGMGGGSSHNPFLTFRASVSNP